MKGKFLLVLILICGGIATESAFRSINAQVPETFENLQVLEPDIEANALMDTMKEFAVSLGVRCTHCHDGEEGQPLSTYEFASDDKPAKQAARAMLRMTQEINRKHLPELPNYSDIATTCGSCHRGQLRPRTLRQELDAAYAADGLPAALEKYRSLREEMYGAGVYDFRERALILYASSFMERGSLDDTVEVLKLGAELFPDSAESRMMLAMSYLQLGDREKALEFASEAEALDPENPRVQQLLEQLQ